MSKFWKNAGIMAFAELFLKLKAFIMMPFITKYLGTMNYGIWSQVLVMVSLLSPLVFLGTDTALAKYLPGQSAEQQRRDFSGWFLFGATISLLILLLVWQFCAPLSLLVFGTAEEYQPFVILAAFNVVVVALSAGIRNWFRIQNSAKAIVIFTILQNITQMLVLIWVLIEKKSIYDFVLVSVIWDFVLVMGYIGYFFAKKIFVWPAINHLRSYLKFGIVLLPGAYAIWGTNSLDRIFMAHYNSISDIGIYSIAFTIGYTLIQTVVNPIWMLFFTQASEFYNLDKIKDLTKLFNQSLKLIFWLIIPAIFGLILVGDNLLRLLTTEEFSQGYMVIPLILTGYFFLMLSGYFESILYLRNKPHLPSAFLIVSFVVNLILNIILIPKYSYIGAAVATMLAFLVQNALSLFYFKKEKLVDLDAKMLFKIFNISLVMFSIMFIFKLLFSSLSDLLAIILISSMGFLLYVSISHFYRIYSFSELRLFMKEEQS